jgi:hypothetical protein
MEGKHLNLPTSSHYKKKKKKKKLYRAKCISVFRVLALSYLQLPRKVFMFFDIRSGSYCFFTMLTNLLVSFIQRYLYRAGFNYCIIILCSIMWLSLALLL